MKNLLGRLMGRSFDDLHAIAAAWHIPVAELNHNDAAIVIFREMAEKANVRAIWEILDTEQRAFLHWLLDQRNALALVDELPAHLSRTPAEVGQLLAGLSALGLCDVEEALVRGNRVVSAGDNLYAWGVRNQTPATKRRVVSMAGELGRALAAVSVEALAGEPFAEPLAVLLDRLDVPVLERIAARWHMPDLRYMAKPALIEMLDAMLEGADTRERMLCEVSTESRRLFEYLCQHEGRAPAGEVQAAFAWGHQELHRHFEPLAIRALAFETLWNNRRVLFVPGPIRAPQGSSGAGAPALVPVPGPPVVESRTATALPWDLLTTLAYFVQNDVFVNRHNNELPKRALKRLQDSFRHPDPATADTYLNLVLHFAGTLELLGEEEDTRRKGRGRRLESWVQLPFSAQLRRLYALWLEDRHLPDDAAPAGLLWRSADLPVARKRLVAHLAACPIDTWFSLPAFLQHIATVDPYLLSSRDELVRQGGVKALRDFQARWMGNEGVLLSRLFGGMLLWMGVIDLGRERDGPPVAFRLTPAGARLINHPAAPLELEPVRKGLLVQPNFDVLVLAADGPAIWTLLQCADLAHHDRVSVYTISKESVLRARAGGLTAPAIQEFLGANSQKAVPQNVSQCILDWGGGYKHLVLQKTTVLEVENAEVLDELLASRRLKGVIARRLTPTIALLKLPRPAGAGGDDPGLKLVKELRAAGYFPQIAEDPRLPEKPRLGRPAAAPGGALAAKAGPGGPAANGKGPGARPARAPRRPLRKTPRLPAVPGPGA